MGEGRSDGEAAWDRVVWCLAQGGSPANLTLLSQNQRYCAEDAAVAAVATIMGTVQKLKNRSFVYTVIGGGNSSNGLPTPSGPPLGPPLRSGASTGGRPLLAPLVEPPTGPLKDPLKDPLIDPLTLEKVWTSDMKPAMKPRGASNPSIGSCVGVP